MSLSIKDLQARSRAFYAPESADAIDVLTTRAAIAHHRATRKITTLTVPLMRPTLANDLFALFANTHVSSTLVRGSEVMGAYASIQCAPSVGRNLDTKA